MAISVFDLKNRDDVRGFLHTALPGIAVFLVGVGALTASVAPYVVALVLAVGDALLSRANTVDSVRKVVYPILGAAAALGLFLGIVSEVQLGPWLAVLPILFGGSLASLNLTEK